jgi:hypothetical protein
MIRAVLMFSAVLLAAGMAVAQQTDSSPSVDIPMPAATTAAPETSPAPDATTPATTSASTPGPKVPATATKQKTTAAVETAAPPPPVLSNYIPQTPPGEPKVTDAVPGKDGVKRLLVLRGLDKITGRPTNIYAPIGVPVKFATLEITARYCYSTPPSEPPETTAFLQIVDKRADQPPKAMFSGWMLASSPSLNALQHPLYDVWVISCMTNQPGQQAPVVASTAAVKTVSPEVGAKEAMPDLPEGSGQ